MSFDDQSGVKVTWLPIFDKDAAIDQGKVNILRLAKDKGCDGVMHSATGKSWSGEIVADDVRRHTGGKRTDVIAAKYGSAPNCRQFQCIAGRHDCRVAENTLEEHRLSRF